MIPAPITIDGRTGTVVYLDAKWHPVPPEQATMARVLFDDGGTAFYTTNEETVQSIAGLGGITRKFDEAKHPRDKEGKFIEATHPRIFNRPSDVGSYESWGGGTKWGWKDPKTGEQTGMLLTGVPIPREQLPPVLYHVTTNAPAVESSGVLLGLREDGGMGGGQAEGVSFTSSKEDALVIQRELRRAVRVARGEDRIEDLDRYAREDEQMAGLPPHTLDDAVQFAKDQWGPNQQSIEHTFVWDKDLPEDKRGYVGPPPPPEEQERLRRSSMNDALKAYLQIRGKHDEQYPLLKNPLLFGRQEHLAKLDPKNIQILEAAAEDIPADALVTTGSDKFLHEVRVYADVPRRHKKAAFDESKVVREPSGTSEGGQFAETGRSGTPTPDPVLAVQAKAGIAAVEKLIPEAVRTANFTAVPGAWIDLPESTREKVFKYFESTAYDEISANLNDSELSIKVYNEVWQAKGAEIAEAATAHVAKTFADRPVDRYTLQRGAKTSDEAEEQNQNLRLDPATIIVPDPQKRNFMGHVVLDLDALRYTDGQKLTDFEKDTVRQIWEQHYAKIVLAEVEKVKDTDAYLAEREKLVMQRLTERWEAMPEARRLELIPEMIATGEDVSYGETTRRLPAHWVTGIETGTHDEDNYARTHALAQRLTELRTEELRKERGLMEVPREKPTYTITTGKFHTEERPNYLIKDKNDQVVGAANSLEQATLNAESWAEEHRNLPVVPTMQLIGDVWDQWKRKSSDGLSLSLQLAASRELGGHHRMTEMEVIAALQTAETYGGIETLQAYVRAQWEVTQTVMRKAGEQNISVYRGLMLPGEKVDAARHLTVSEAGTPLKPPTNIKTGTDKQTGAPFVSYDFDENHFVVIKEREPAKNILDLDVEPQAWNEVDTYTKERVRERFLQDAKDVLVEGVDPAKAVQIKQGLFDKMSEGGKFSLMLNYTDRGWIPHRTQRPPRPWESDESAIQRRMNKYLEDVQSKRYEHLFTKLPDLTLQRAGAQSTTGTRSVANDWGGVDVGDIPDPTRVVLRIQAPSTSVLSLPVYGQNVSEEHESVLMGTKDKWLWDAWVGRAPDVANITISGAPVPKKPLVDWGEPIDYDTQMALKSDPLVVDLQAEDRGKPHWLTGVDWSKVLKWDESQHPREPKGGPDGGQFTSEGVRVALTSQRPVGDPGHQSNVDVFRHMREFHEQLQALPGVSAVSVKPGVGGWEGGSESMWQIYYKGNGEARKLVARTAKAFNQDAVLILEKCKGKNCQPAVELSFEGAITPVAREQIHRVLVANGIGGWTWMKRDGKTLLRMVSVPQWGGEAKKHQQATAEVSKQLRSNGRKNHRRVHKVAVSTMEREGYDEIISGA